LTVRLNQDKSINLEELGLEDIDKRTSAKQIESDDSS
jgi:hypothetical protein